MAHLYSGIAEARQASVVGSSEMAGWHERPSPWSSSGCICLGLASICLTQTLAPSHAPFCPANDGLSGTAWPVAPVSCPLLGIIG